MATFNVFPEQVAPFFNKLQCFCFTEQRLEPGESAQLLKDAVAEAVFSAVMKFLETGTR